MAINEERDSVDGCFLTIAITLLCGILSIMEWLLPQRLDWITHTIGGIIFIFIFIYMITSPPPEDGDPPYL